MLHIDDWLDQPATDQDRVAKVFLSKFRVPAAFKDHKWLDSHPLFCTFDGKRWRCTGCSRLGDVWLAADFKRVCGYDLRVDVSSCSDWSTTP